jgi:hypothetical protein
VQDFFFDKDLHLRRHDYTVDVAGSFSAAQLLTDYFTPPEMTNPARPCFCRLELGFG